MSFVHELRRSIAPLLSIVGGAIEAGQVDVVEEVLGSVIQVVQVYLRGRPGGPDIQDPIMAGISEELFGLAQSAHRARSQQVLPELIRVLGRLADVGIGVSSGGLGPDENNVGYLAMSQLKLVAVTNLTNINSTAADTAANELGRLTSKLLSRGLPASTAGVVENDLAVVMGMAVRPFAYHVANTCAGWLINLWVLASTIEGGYLVRKNMNDAIEILLKAYGEQPITYERGPAIAAVIDHASGGGQVPPTRPAGAAVVASLLFATADEADVRLIEDARTLADRIVRYLLWPTMKGRKDWRGAKWAVQEAIEIASLMAAIACGTMRTASRRLFPDSVGEAMHLKNRPDDPSWQNERIRREAADAWEWITGMLLGACEALADEKTEHDVNVDQWTACDEALTGVAGALVAAL